VVAPATGGVRTTDAAPVTEYLSGDQRGVEDRR